MPQTQIPVMESFTIPITEWKTVDAGKNTIRIKGVALKGNVVSLNQRQYIAKELMKSTNTFINKPVNLHHANPNQEKTNIGRLTWMDWDPTAELLTYEAEITKQPYVDMLRNKSAEIRGVSIQANFLHNKCPDCQTKFYEEATFQRHMWDRHFKKVSAVPHGIIGEALTLVLSPEVPGYEGTTVELAETARRETLRLLETVIKTEQEKENYMNTLTSKVTSWKAPEPQKPKEEITENLEDDLVTIQKQIDTLEKQRYPPTQEDSEEKKHQRAQLDILYAKKQKMLGTINPDNQKSNEIALLTPNIRESAPKLKLGEPFADYVDFADCVASNSGKENPEAYCGTIKKQTEETLHYTKMVTDKINELVFAVNNLPADDKTWIHQIGEVKQNILNELENIRLTIKETQTSLSNIPADDKTWEQKLSTLEISTQNSVQKLTETVNNLPKPDITLPTRLTEAENHINKLTETIGKTPTQIAEKIAEAKNQIAESIPKDFISHIELQKITDSIPKDTLTHVEFTKTLESLPKPYDDTQMKTSLSTFETKLSTLTSENKTLKETLQIETAKHDKAVSELKETVSKQKTDFDNLLAAADKNIKEEVGKRETQIEELKRQVTEKDKQLKETLELATRVENIEDKLPSNYKGHSPKNQPPPRPLVKDPMTPEVKP